MLYRDLDTASWFVQCNRTRVGFLKTLTTLKSQSFNTRKVKILHAHHTILTRAVMHSNLLVRSIKPLSFHNWRLNLNTRCLFRSVSNTCRSHWMHCCVVYSEIRGHTSIKLVWLVYRKVKVYVYCLIVHKKVGIKRRYTICTIFMLFYESRQSMQI